MAEEIRADYQKLTEVAKRFANQAQAVQQTHSQVSRAMQNLQGQWIGLGHDAFFSEMEQKVLPASNRLHQALQEASTAVGKIAQTLRQAEQEASAPFQTQV